ncbi:MAG: hypothetical protein FWH02_05560 [Oscillospiraceae bacterium]|nr:hypothetical protein [Oscillospiraceae bacterium]
MQYIEGYMIHADTNKMYLTKDDKTVFSFHVPNGIRTAAIVSQDVLHGALLCTSPYQNDSDSPYSSKTKEYVVRDRENRIVSLAAQQYNKEKRKADMFYKCIRKHSEVTPVFRMSEEPCDFGVVMRFYEGDKQIAVIGYEDDESCEVFEYYIKISAGHIKWLHHIFHAYVLSCYNRYVDGPVVEQFHEKQTRS